MFTGIVSSKGNLQKIVKFDDYTSMVIKAPKGFAKNLSRGASVSVNGVCLTVKKGKTDLLEFDVIKEKSLYGRKYMGVDRSTFIINKDAKVVYAWRNVKVKGHVEEVIDKLKDLK